MLLNIHYLVSFQTLFNLLCSGEECLFSVNTSAVLISPDNESYVIYKDSRVYTLQMFIANQGDAIIHPEIKLNLPPGVSFSSVNFQAGQPSYSCSADSDVISCNLGPVMKNGTSIIIEAKLYMGKVEDNVTLTTTFGSGAVLRNNENTTFSVVKHVRNLAKLKLFG